MLAQILPGFRDFKTPLITGYLWLVIIWVGFGMPIPSKAENTGAMGMINWLTGYTSSATILAVLSFTAYVIGILLIVDVKIATRLVSRFGFTFQRQLNENGKKKWVRLPHRDNMSYRRSLANESGSTLLKLLWEAFTRVEEKNVPWSTIHKGYHLPEIDEAEYEELRQEAAGDRAEVDRQIRKNALRTLSPTLSREMDNEIPVLATKLQEKNKDLFDSYDRDRSEAEFRLSIAPPIAVLSAQLFLLGIAGNGILGSLFAATGLAMSIVLLRKGWLKVLDSTSVVVTALEIGTVTSHVIERLEGLEGKRPSVVIPPAITV
ncbi:hypothetical protein NNX39_15380 [Arthrobacter sp. zg-Y826]|uniref:hypothetical protein n=1 Tax=Arthrobacter jinronghuae TaxID=2964609 RepID=UPI0021059854|nr:hypothetical protein [Arthrobacter jinronghuae]MCQ1957876.1 hypothetical protein [Arthrobacter jinronghuae]